MRKLNFFNKTAHLCQVVELSCNQQTVEDERPSKINLDQSEVLLNDISRVTELLQNTEDIAEMPGDTLM